MIDKKKILMFFLISLLGACTSPTAMLGPIYTFSSTGSTLQTGLSYGSNKLIEKYTGKTPIENLMSASLEEEKNIHKQTLESDDFYFLVENKIKKTNALLNNSNR